MKQKKYTKEELIDYLHRLKNIIGRTPRTIDMNKQKEMPNCCTFIRHFGSWNNAIHSAGFEHNVIQSKYTKEQLINNIHKLKQKLKRIPRIVDVNNDNNYPSSHVFDLHFGSWNRALQSAGLKLNIKHNRTKEELIELLKQYKKEYGKIPSSCDLRDTKGYPNDQIYRDLFGSWSNALREAGLYDNTPKLYNDKKWLYEEYILKKKNMGQLAEISGCSVSNIKNRLVKYDIKIRSPLETRELKHKDNLYRNKEWLYQKYSVEQMNTHEIGNITKTDPKTIRCWLNRFNIKTRDVSTAQLIINGNLQYKNKEWLYQKYIVEGLSTGQIGDLTNNAPTTIHKWLKELGIPTRSPVELMNSENNPMNDIESRRKASASHQGISLNEWEGFISHEPYTIDFNERFKEAIRKRDNCCCVICNRSQEELSEHLSVHHIDYDKKNSLPQNCVSLCRSHHTDTNHNRDHWKTFFQSLLKDWYGYEYTMDQKIILDFNKAD